MAKKFDETNRGITSNNDYKKDAKHPDVRGHINVNGLYYNLSGWNNVGQSGRAYTSWSVELMTQQEADKMHARAEARSAPQQPTQQQPTQQAPNREPQQQQNPPAGHPAGEPPVNFDDDIPF